MTWTAVAPESSLPPRALIAHDQGDVRIAVWRTGGGVVVACDARCPHQWSDLATEGVVDGDELVCTAHLWRFEASGEGSKRSMSGRRDPKSPVAVHPTRIRDGWIEVDL